MKKTEINNKDNIDDWFLKNLIKTIIDSLIVLLRLIRPTPSGPIIPNTPNKPIIPLPNKPIFPWLRKKIDTIFEEKKND